MKRNVRRSIRELSAEVATNPDSAAFVELVAAYRERGDLDRALRLCLRGLARHPTHVEAHFELGRVYEERGERELALDEWGIVRRLAPDHIEARLRTVRLLLREGRTDPAARELRSLHEIAPDDPRVRELWGRFGHPESRPAARDARADEPSPEAPAPPSADPPVPARSSGPEMEAPGSGDGLVQGTLLLDAEGSVVGHELPNISSAARGELADTLRGVRAEAERMTEYLGLGAWTGLVVEGSRSRLAIEPLDPGVVTIWTDARVPAGRAARAVSRARARVAAQRRNGGR